MLLVPSSSCTVAPTGQTTSHGAFSQCMQGTGWKYGPSASSALALSPAYCCCCLFIVHGCAHRGEHFRPRLFRMHSRPRVEILAFGLLRAWPLRGIIVVDPQPVHLAAAHHLIFPDDGDVVLALTRCHVGV